MAFRSPITGKFVSLAVARRWNYPSEAQRLARLKNIKKAQQAQRVARRKPVTPRKKPTPTPRKERKKKPTPRPRAEREEIFAPDVFIPDRGEFVSEQDDFLFEQAGQLEDFEFDELADIDFDYVDFLDEIGDEFDDVEETDYEEIV